jgi:hypothetical protein
VLAARGPLYESLADWTLDVDALDHDATISAILDAWRAATDARTQTLSDTASADALRDDEAGPPDHPSS